MRILDEEVSGEGVPPAGRVLTEEVRRVSDPGFLTHSFLLAPALLDPP